MADFSTISLPIRPKRATDTSGDDSTPNPAANPAAVAGASEATESKTRRRTMEKLREMEANWRDCLTGGPVRDFLPREIRPREMVNRQRVLFGNQQARILENEEYPPKLVNALHHLSLLTKDDLNTAVSRPTKHVENRHVFGDTGHGSVPNQYVLEVLPKGVWDLVAQMKKDGYTKKE